MTRIAFIAGLEHSGTTLLDFIVGRREGAVALGEVCSFVNSDLRAHFLSRFGRFEEARLCSCGKPHSDCNIWSAVVRYMQENPSSDGVMRYRKVIETIEENFGNEIILSDSSKSIHALKTVWETVRNRPGTDLKVLFAIKDVRAFVTSIAESKKLRLRGQISCFRWWRGGNEDILSFLQRSHIPYQIVLYEALCLRTRSTVEKIDEFLGLTTDDVETPGTTIAHDRSHICTGNADMVFRNRNEIKYDCRWFNRRSINFLYGVDLKTRKLNEHLLAEHLQI